MKRLVVVLFGVLLSTALTAFPGSAFAKDNSINVGGVGMVGPDLSASVFLVEYERLMGNGISMFGRLGSLDYDFDDGWYKEEGDGPGFDIGMRKYMGGDRMKGFYIGMTIGLWWTEWTYTDTDYAPSSQYYSGEGESTAVKVDFEVGGRFPLGESSVSLIPSFHIGNFFSIDDTCTSTSVPGADCGAESEVGFYGVFGLALGIGF